MAFKDLNDKQKEAVLTTEGPLLILAGAGSGKTSTMTHRIAHLVETGVDPYNILAVTFTNKAANEMRSRVEELIGDIQGMWVMTFHAMCLRILHVFAEEAGYKDNFVIYDTADQKTLMKNILKDKGIPEKEYPPQYVLAVISDCKEKEIDPETYKRESGTTEKNKIIYSLYSEYENTLRSNNAMDFDDLLLNTVRLFKTHEEVLEKYRRRFLYVMVDEYQDTNHVQYELVSMLAGGHRNLCVVGDDDQCIYEWRGADITNILDFEKDFPDARVIKLEQNYRSVGNILEAAHSVIKNNRGRKPKKLWTDREAGEKINYSRCDSDKEEANYVTRQIDFLNRHAGKSYSDIAILYRTNAQSRLFEEALSRYGIPYRVLSGTRYYDRKEIKDAMAYMRLVVNPSDDLSLIRVINEPKRGIGAKTLEKLAVFARVRGQSMLEALMDGDEELLSAIPNKSYDSVKEMIQCIRYCRDNKDTVSVSEIFDTLMVRTGYMKALESQNTVEAEARMDNLMEFKTVIKDYEAGFTPDQEERPTLEGFMEQLTLAAEVDAYDESQPTVTLMTMHSAKGLEFPVVFMPGLEDGLFPGSKSFDSTEGMEEERRLCYVGMTRAKELLYLSSAEVRTRYGRTEFTRESQFLRELDKSLVTGDAVYEKKSFESSLGVSTGSPDGFAAEPYHPFDSLKYAKTETRKAAAAVRNEADYAEGDKVSHPKFGEGLVIDMTPSIVTVAFDSVGIKKLAIGIAPLKKV